jgi:mRNA-degrading endonuclease toxin of MazEF toxin-antitoxin module
MKWGDLVLVRFPDPSGQRGQKRAAVVVQSDAYASTVSTVVVAEVRFAKITPVVVAYSG